MNRIVKNTLYLYSRQLFTLFLSLYTSRLTLQVLGVTDFGIFAAVGGITAFLSIATASMSNSTQRFLTFSLGKHDIEQLNKTYISSIEIHIFLSLVLLLLAESFGLFFFYEKLVIPEERLATAFWVYQFSVLTAIVNIIAAPYYAEIVAHEDMGIIAILYVLDAIIKVISVLVLFQITYDKLFIYAVFVLIIQLLFRISTAIYCKLKYEECHFYLFFDKKLCLSMMSLTSWNLVSNLGVMGFIQGTNILLNIFFGTAINAAYSISYQAYWGIRNFTSSFQLASNPQIVKLYSENHIKEMRDLLLSVCRFSFYLVFILSFPIIMNSHYILNLWLKEVPDHAQYFFILLLVFSYLDVYAYPLDVAAQATGKVKNYSISVFLSFFSILLISYVLFKYGAIPETIIYVAIIISLLSILIRVWYLSKSIDLSIFEFLQESFKRPIMVVAAVCPLVYYVKCELGNLSLYGTIIFLFAILVYEVFVISVFGLNQPEKKIVKEYCNKLSSIINTKSKL
jgi:O-antigen/teichoic acid export membrane protein